MVSLKEKTKKDVFVHYTAARKEFALKKGDE